MTRAQRVEVLQPDQRATAGVHEVGRPIELVRACRARPPRSTGRGAGGLGQPPGELEHPWAEVDADDLVGAEVPEGKRVAATGALQMDGAPAAAVEVADQLGLDAEQVRAARADQGDGLVEPALVSLGRLVPGASRLAACIARTSAASAGVAGLTMGVGSSCIDGACALDRRLVARRDSS